MAAAFLMFLLMHIEAQAQTYSILMGTVTEVHSRYLVITSNESGTIQLRVGRRTVYPNRIPIVGDKVKVEYLITRGVYMGYSVAILESGEKEIKPQRKVIESQAQVPSREQTEWLLGLWKGIVPGKSETRLLEILTIKRIDDRKMEGKANHGMTGQKMNPIAMTMISEQDGTIQISFTTPAQNKIKLKKASENRMEGSFETKDGKQRTIRFWKEDVIPNIRLELKNYLGTWQGRWSETESIESFDAKVTIAYIDGSAASVRYERETIRQHYKDSKTGESGVREHEATWSWHHATVTPKGTIEYPSGDGKRIFIFELSSDQNSLLGQEKGVTPSNPNFHRRIELSRMK